MTQVPLPNRSLSGFGFVTTNPERASRSLTEDEELCEEGAGVYSLRVVVGDIGLSAFEYENDEGGCGEEDGVEL